MQVVVIYAATNGYFDAIPVPQVRAAEAELTKHMTGRAGNILQTIREKKTLDDALKNQLNETLKEFMASYAAASGAKA
jgi:F-type H+-transporting ATPase subunit alpha